MKKADKAKKLNINEVATKGDLQRLENKVDKSFEDFAGMVSRGFDDIQGAFKKSASDMEDFRREVKNEFRQVHGILIENHEQRIVALEKKTGIAR